MYRCLFYVNNESKSNWKDKQNVIHQYKNNGYNIVLDVNSGSVHVVDDVVYDEFKGTGNMELVLDRKLSEKRVFPAIDIPKSGTRREDLLLAGDEMEAINIIRKALNGLKPEEAVDKILDLFAKTRNNQEFVNMVKKMKWI